VFKWRKLGRVFNPADSHHAEWMYEFAQAPCALAFDNFVRVYFSCRPRPDEEGRYVSYSAYVDLNRKNLFEVLGITAQPVLKLGTLGTFDEFGTYPISVIRDRNQVLAYYGGWTRCESVPFNVAIGYAVSQDNGHTFEKVGSGPVLSYSPDEPFVLSGPKIRRFNDLWYLYYIAGRKWILSDGKAEPVYKIRLAISEDGLHWTRLHKDIIADALGENEAQASPDVFYHEGRYHMFFCYRHPTDYRCNRARSYRIGYASSSDLVNWSRDDAQVEIDVSDEGWDSEMLAYPHVFVLDSKVYMLYLGNQVGRYGFGLAQAC
jgi:hypothetical protein